jgi:RHH-type proline utilization regulon transcriptional repressor/proline dehydrogenase/delta 1-pyrroline-5-carboxylate dehydrogenase
MRTGSVWDTMNIVGPMIDNDNEKLLHAIENLEPGESWLVAPEFLDEKKYILRPTVKWGVKPGSFTFKNELFAPLLGVVCVEDLQQAIDFSNSSEYGLTAGLQTLDEEERKIWKNSIEAGNLYINRGITGAIVRRQPFGGMKRSAFGGGLKAGSPNYVSSFVEFEESASLPVIDKTNPSPLHSLLSNKNEQYRLNFAYERCINAWKTEFSLEKDVSRIYGEENNFRYLPLKSIGFRVEENDALVDVLMVMQAAYMAKTPMTISLSDGNKHKKEIEKAVAKLTGVNIKQQDTNAFIKEMNMYERIRTCSPDLPDGFFAEAAKLGKHIAYHKPLVEGRIELLHYLKEQSISFEYHRYGSIFGEDN